MINVDFADVKAIMTGAGSSFMGQGSASEWDLIVLKVWDRGLGFT